MSTIHDQCPMLTRISPISFSNDIVPLSVRRIVCMSSCRRRVDVQHAVLLDELPSLRSLPVSVKEVHTEGVQHVSVAHLGD